MTTVSVPREKLAKVLSDVELLIADVSSLVDEDTIAKDRLTAMRTDPSVRRSEDDLDEYLAKRGVHVGRVED